MRAAPRPLAEITEDELASLMAGMEAEASSPLLAGGVQPGLIRLDRRADMRYRGQGYEIEVPLPEGGSIAALLAALPGLFAEQYRAVFHALLSEPVEVVSWKVEAIGPAVERFATAVAEPDRARDPRTGTRPAYFPSLGGFVDCPVFARDRLPPGTVLIGPALVEERESTCLLDGRDRGLIDESRNLVIEIEAA